MEITHSKLLFLLWLICHSMKPHLSCFDAIPLLKAGHGVATHQCWGASWLLSALHPSDTHTQLKRWRYCSCPIPLAGKNNIASWPVLRYLGNLPALARWQQCFYSRGNSSDYFYYMLCKQGHCPPPPMILVLPLLGSLLPFMAWYGGPNKCALLVLFYATERFAYMQQQLQILFGSPPMALALSSHYF